MARTLQSSLVVSLLDRVTAPARAVAKSISGIGRAVAAANGGHLAQMAAANSRALAGMRASMLEAVGVGYALSRSLGAPLGVATEFETALLDIAQKSDLSDDAMKKLGQRIRALAPQVNKTAQEVASGIDVLTSMGLDPDRALAISPALGKAATAYRAEMSDVAKMTFAAIDNLKVPVAETMRLLDSLSYAAKAGAFEFNDMARFFPSIAAAAQAMGQKGVVGAARIGAALETIRKGVGTSSEAATDLQNIFQKMEADEARKKFAKFGIDVRKELDKVKAEGGDVLEKVADLVMKATGGRVDRIGDIYADKEVKEGLTAFIQNWAEYRRIRDESLKAGGTVESDFNRRMKTMAARMDALKTSVTDLGITIGEILLPPVEDMIAVIKPVVEQVRDFAKANPGLVGSAVKAATALIGMTVAARAARWSYLFLRGGLLMIAQPALKAVGAIKKVAKSISVLPAIRGIGAWFAGLRQGFLSLLVLGATAGPGAAFKALGSAFLGLLNPLRFLIPLAKIVAAVFSPLGIVVVAIATAIAAAGVFIYNNWSGLKAMFLAFGLAFMKALGPAQPVLAKVGAAFDKVGNGLAWLWGKIMKLLGPISLDTWARWGAAAGEAVGNIVAWLLELPGKIARIGADLYVTGIEWLGRLRDGVAIGFVMVKDFFAALPTTLVDLVRPLATRLYGVGVEVLTGLWDGMKAKATAVLDWVMGLGGRIRDALISRLPAFIVNAMGVEGEEPAAAKQDAAGKPAPSPANENAPAPKAATGPKGPRLYAVPRRPTPEMSTPTGEAAEKLGDLNQTVTPGANLSGLAPLEQALDRILGKVDRLNDAKVSIGLGGSGGSGLRAGGDVGFTVRGGFSDAGR